MDCLKIVGGSTPSRGRVFAMLPQRISPPSPAPIDQNDDAPVRQGEGAEGLRPARQDLRGLPRPVMADTATRDLRPFQLPIAQQGISAGSIGAAVTTLRFFSPPPHERPDLVRPPTTVNTP